MGDGMEHVAVLCSPDEFVKTTPEPNWQDMGADVVWGTDARGGTRMQEVRFAGGAWTADKARAWLETHKLTATEFTEAERQEGESMATTPVGDARIIEDQLTLADYQVDESAGIIRGVALLSRESRDSAGKVRRRYQETAHDSAVRVFEGAQVFANHAAQAGTRDVRDLVGNVANVRRENGYVRGDLHVLEHQRAWVFALARQPQSKAGMSWDGFGRRTEGEDGVEIVEDIRVVNSIDIVSAGGTVSNLFEARADGDRAGDEGSDMAEGNGKLEQMLERLQESVADATTKLATKDAEISALQTELATVKESAVKAQRQADIDAVLTEAKITREDLGEDLVQLMEACPDVAKVKSIVEGIVKLRGTTDTTVKGDPGHTPFTEGRTEFSPEDAAAMVAR